MDSLSEHSSGRGPCQCCEFRTRTHPGSPGALYNMRECPAVHPLFLQACIAAVKPRTLDMRYSPYTIRTRALAVKFDMVFL